MTASAQSETPSEWRRLDWGDRSIHLLPESGGILRRAACGVYYNVRFTRRARPTKTARKCSRCVREDSGGAGDR